MKDGQAGVSGRPAGRGRILRFFIWTVAVLCGLAALVLGGIGWTIQYWPPTDLLDGIREVVDIGVRTVKVLLLSDIYYDTTLKTEAMYWLEPARALGVISSVLIAVRLLLFAIGSRLSEVLYRWGSWGHDVVVGMGPAAVEYAATHSSMFTKRRAIHLASERMPTAKRLATFERRGGLDVQLRHAAAYRASRIVVDEGDDADTWQTAQAIARSCKGAEVLAHITDPWMRDRLSREVPTFRLTPFSYAGGASRQVMLAHPPYLLAKKLKAPTPHILIVGFGQVGQSVAREFIATSVVPSDMQMMVTVVDPQAKQVLAAEFSGRHEELVKHVDFDFLEGDFRLNDEGLRKEVKARAAKAPMCAVFVAIDLERRPLGLALALRAMALQHDLFRAPIFVCAQHGAGLPAVDHGSGYVGDPAEDRAALEKKAEQDGKLCDLRVVTFGSWQDLFDGSGMFERDFDGQARRYHKEYERLSEEQAKADGNILLNNPREPWEILPDQMRVSNRRVASHLRAKAHVAGFNLEGWLAEDGRRDTFELPPAAAHIKIDDATFMDTMTRLEHQRWMLDRFLDGWRHGPRDNYLRMRDNLVPYDQLNQDDVKKDYAVVKTTRLLMEGKSPGGKRRT